MRFLPAFFSALLVLSAIAAPAWNALADEDHDQAAAVRQGIAAVCPELPSNEEALLADFKGVEGFRSEPIEARGSTVGMRFVLTLAEVGELRLERMGRAGMLGRVTSDLRAFGPEGAPRPTVVAVAGHDCRIAHALRLVYDSEGQAETLQILSPSLQRVVSEEPLNPPVPAGDDPGGVRVAVVDSGVNYTLPFVAERLARDEAGEILGFDYWDMDRRPFDANPAASPYFPQRHGTAVASVLLREAAEAALVPYRYPRPDMARMGALVEGAARAGVTIMVMPLGSRDREDWTAFETAARDHPEMLFIVAAGNTGESLDEHPMWPPALDLANMIVVTSAEADGRLGRGSSWGRRSVDLMVPGEDVPVIDWQGQESRGAGSSYAAPRLGALAARLKAANPQWNAPELKTAILSFAEKAPEDPPLTAHGWIPEPEALP